MSSRRSFHAKANENRGRACRAEGCNIGRKAVSPYCRAHARAVERYGHPLGRAIRPKEYAVERELVEKFVARQLDHEGLLEVDHEVA
jgi:hypothetical protein